MPAAPPRNRPATPASWSGVTRMSPLLMRPPDDAGPWRPRDRVSTPGPAFASPARPVQLWRASGTTRGLWTDEPARLLTPVDTPQPNRRHDRHGPRLQP